MQASESTVEEQFDDAEQQYLSDVFGMWVFLCTEILFFGVLFVVYTVYRYSYPEVFVEAAGHLHLWAGAANTAVLLTSSLTMTMAAGYARAGRRKPLRTALSVTALLGTLFLAVKGWEYHEKYAKGLVPFAGEAFAWSGDAPEHAQIFFNLYFASTGLHALHLATGIGTVAVLIFLSFRSKDRQRLSRQVEISGLYWHFVDIIWLLLFPLLYLVR